MNFKLPKINEVIKMTKDNVDDVKNHIYILKGVAFVYQNNMIVCVNLRSYLKTEMKISETEDIEKMDEILQWMEGKVFTTGFWKELTKLSYVTLFDEGFLIEEVSYNKNLIYEYPDISQAEIDLLFDKVKSLFDRKNTMTDKICIRGSLPSELNKIFGSELKTDDLLFDFGGRDKPTLFSGRSKDYIFGAIPVKFDESNELLAFQNTKDFVQSFNQI